MTIGSLLALAAALVAGAHPSPVAKPAFHHRFIPLRCRYGIPVRDVIGHAESLSSPFHRERVAALRTQTHGDWQPWAMRRYRALLRARGGC